MQPMPPDIERFLIFLLTFVIEIWRVRVLSRLGLGLPWRGGWRYAYYLPWTAACAGGGWILALGITALLQTIWDWLTSRGLFTLAGFYMVLLAGGIAFLFYAALHKVKPNFREIAPLLAVGTLLDLALFSFSYTRWIFGGTLFLLITSAAGELIPFVSWDDLVRWLHRPERRAGRRSEAGESCDVRFLIEANGILLRKDTQVELDGEEIVEPAEDPAADLPQRLLDENRLTRIIAALEEVKGRQDILDVVPSLIVRNLRKLIALYEGMAQDDRLAGEKEALLESHIRGLLDERLGPEVRDLLYWNYGYSESGRDVRVHVTRVPKVDMKLIITFPQYLGVYLSSWERRSRARR